MLLKLASYFLFIPTYSKIFTYLFFQFYCVNDINDVHNVYGVYYTREQGVSSADFRSESACCLHVHHHHPLRNYFTFTIVVPNYSAYELH